MNFDILSFILGKLNYGSDFNNIVSYLLGKTVSAVWKTISNVSVASFTAVVSPLKEFIVAITPMQSGSGDPTPDNVRPISGWGSVSLGQTLAGYVMPKIEQGGINVSGDETTALDRCRSDYVTAPVESGKAFFAVTGNDVRVIAIHRYYADKTRRDRISYDYVKSGSIAISGNNFTIKYLRFVLAKSDGNSNIIPSDIENLVVAPYSSISLGQTVYGGTLTDNGDGTWTLTVTHILAAVRWGDVSGTTYGNYVRKDFDGAFAQNVSIDSVINSTRCINNVGATYRANSTSAELHYYIRNNTGLRVFLPSTTDNDFIFQATGYLMIPQSYTLTAESVKTLLGNNNIFSDTGNIITITYREK